MIALSLISIPAIVVGLALAKATGFGIWPSQSLANASGHSQSNFNNPYFIAVIGGIIIGALLLAKRNFLGDGLPAELPAFGHRGVVGGLAVSIGAAVAEEVWFRLGLMSLLVWGALKLLPDPVDKSKVVVGVILFAALAFALAHIPQLNSYGAASTSGVVGTIAGNMLVGSFYGWCFWRHGLVVAITAHFSVDVVLHVLPAMV